MAILVATSDTHGMHRKLNVPKGDIFIHAGDFCRFSKEEEVAEFQEWMASLPHKHKILVPGNHDTPMDKRTREGWEYKGFEKRGIHVLTKDTLKIEGRVFAGYSYTPSEYPCWGFANRNMEDARKRIPWFNNVDVFISHGPAFGTLDTMIVRSGCMKGARAQVGCPMLKEALRSIQPKIHIHGHIHESRGKKTFENVDVYNVACLDETYKKIRSCFRIEI